MTHRTVRALLAACGLWSPVGAHAVGTAAGTEIRNQAEVTFDLNGSTLTRDSNATTLRVLELIDVNLLTETAERVVNAGAQRQPLLFRLTNTGNGTESFALRFDNALAGDDFDPVAPAVALYFDSDASGTLTAADTPYVPGANDPTLAADQSIDLLLVEDIPSGVLDGQRGLAGLRAAAGTASGSPGTFLTSGGDGGVDALLGASGASAAALGRYLVGSVLLTLTKSAAVQDGSGGSEPLPGATILYTVRVSAAGSGTATAAAFQDAIPAHTSYVGASLKLNGAPLSDAADADAGEYVAATPAVVVALGDVDSSDGVLEVQFAVRIN